MDPSDVHFFVNSLRLTFSYLEVSPYHISVFFLVIVLLSNLALLQMAHETSLTLRLQSPITIEISFKAGHG
jgi:hypothetical protein